MRVRHLRRNVPGMTIPAVLPEIRFMNRRFGDQLPTRMPPAALQAPVAVPMGTPVVLNRSTPVWSAQKARWPVTPTAAGEAFTSKPLFIAPVGVFPTAANVYPLFVYGATLIAESTMQAAAAVAGPQGFPPPRLSMVAA